LVETESAHWREGRETDEVLVSLNDLLSGVGENEVHLDSTSDGDVVEDGPLVSVVSHKLELGGSRVGEVDASELVVFSLVHDEGVDGRALLASEELINFSALESGLRVHGISTSL